MPASGEIIQVTFRYLVDGQLCENVLNFRERAPATTDAHIGNDILLFLSKLSTIQSGNATYLQPMWKKMTPVAFDEQFTPLGSVTAGAVGGALLNSTISLVTTLRTGVSGKRHRGRMYIGGLPDVAGADRIATGFQPNVTAFINDLKATFDDAAGTSLYLALGIYSKLIGGTSPYTVAGWQPVTQYVAQTIFGNQRRRRVGVGV
jgi:hypothetical protein